MQFVICTFIVPFNQIFESFGNVNIDESGLVSCEFGILYNNSLLLK